MGLGAAVPHLARPGGGDAAPDTEHNSVRPHSALGGKPPLTWLATPRAPSEMTKVTATSDPEPRFVAAAGVKPREATAEGGLGLTPTTATLAKPATGWDNLLGNDSSWRSRPTIG